MATGHRRGREGSLLQRNPTVAAYEGLPITAEAFGDEIASLLACFSSLWPGRRNQLTHFLLLVSGLVFVAVALLFFTHFGRNDVRCVII